MKVLPAILCIVAVVLAGVVASPLAADRTQPVVETAVFDQLAASTDGRVYVLVVLTKLRIEPSAPLATRMSAVDAVQDRVLSVLDPSEFQVVYRYKTFAALTGWINASGLAKLSANAEVRSIGLNGEVRMNLNVSVPFINADLVQNNLGVTGAGVTIAVLDTGIDTDHADFVGNIAAGAQHFLDDGGDVGPGAEDDQGHGTNVSGIIAGNGTVAPVGVAPDADILAVKVLDEDGSGFVSDIAAGIDYVVANAGNYANLCAINMSLGGGQYEECPCDDEDSRTELEGAAIDAAVAAGIMVIVASGNSGWTDAMSAPGCLSNAVAVAAVYDQDLGREPDAGTYFDAFGGSVADCFDAATFGDLIVCFSNRSPCNALAAPGRNILAAGMGGGTSNFTGTSMASPHVAGVAALMCQCLDDQGLSMTPGEMRTVLLNTGVATNDPAGTTPNPVRVDAWEALLEVDQTAPVITCPSDVTVECADHCGTPADDPQLAAFFAGVSATDMCDASPVVTNDAPECFPLGATVVTFTATDDAGNATTCEATVTVEDTIDPEITVVLDRDVLWPPNHKMVTICATVDVFDICDPDLTFVLESISSDEPDDDGGDGHFPNDIQNAEFDTADECFDLRSERQGGGDGRVYTIVFCVTDHSGNETCATVQVDVPHDQGAGAAASSGFIGDGTSFAPGADQFAVIIPSVDGIDAGSLDRSQIMLGNTAGIARPVSTRLVELNRDGRTDLALFFSTADAMAILTPGDEETDETLKGMRKGRINDGPLGVHFVSASGVDYLVSDIFVLGAPVEMPSVGLDEPPPMPFDDGDDVTVQTTGLKSIHPNPFNPQTTVAFSLASEGLVRIAIYDVRGTLVRRLTDEVKPAGDHTSVWNGVDDAGRPAASGIYFVRMIAGSYQETRKIVMLK
jgi:subtilisin family serine protease